MLRVFACMRCFFRLFSHGKIFVVEKKMPHRLAVRREILLLDDVVLRAIREFGDVFPALFVDDQDVVFTITAGTWQAFGIMIIGSWTPPCPVQYRVDVFAQFQPGFATIVMGQRAEGMAIAEGAVLQQVVLAGKSR